MAKERTAFSTRRFLVGKAGPFPRLVFREEVMLSLDQFAHLHSKGEQGGFLIGRKRNLNTAEKYEVIVERFVPIPQRDDASRLVINQEHLRSVARMLRGGDEPEVIVGWFHTHPGFGVFLSNFDKEQHLRFFSDPWQVAYVMDTQGNERAVYHSIDGEWFQLGGYYVLREMGANELGITEERANPWTRVVLGALLFLFTLGAGSYGYTLVRQMLVPKTKQYDEVTSHQSPIIIVQEKESGAQTSESNPPPPSSVSLYGEYVVQKGDNLWTIAQKLWGDPSLFSLLAKENNIENPSSIPVGKILRVPERPNN